MIEYTVSPQHPELAPIVKDIAEHGMPEGVVYIHRGRNTIAYIKEPPLNIKAYRPPGRWKGMMYGMLRAPKARRAYLFAHRLAELGIYTPEPMAFIEERRDGRLCRSYYISRQLFGWREIRGVEYDHVFEELIEPLARFLVELHEKGVNMKDMTPGNVLFRKEDGGEYRFCLVDINRMSFETISKDIVVAHFAGVLNTREGILRVARRYAELRHWNADDFVDEIAAACVERRLKRLRKRRLKKLFKKKK